jgi:hypothetical protein
MCGRRSLWVSDGTFSVRPLRHRAFNESLYLAPPRLHSEPHMTVCPSVVRTDHFHRLRPRRFSTMSNAAKRSSPVRQVTPLTYPEAAMELIQQPLLTLDPASVQFVLLLGLRARQQQAIVADNLLAAADQQVSNAGS